VSRARRAPRHASRQVALQVLFALDMGPASAPVEEVFERVADNFDLPEGARAFAKQLVCGVIADRERIDAVLARHARNWRLPRMAAVDRNVLRLGAYEILHTDTPAAVALDQAVELARRFGAEGSPAFVNGVLDAVARERGRPEEPPR
jgi:N utilization substance protein B